MQALLTKRRLDLALENVALRHQLEVVTRNRKRALLRPADRLLWSWLARLWPMATAPRDRPAETVVRWHGTTWRRYWTWRSSGRRRRRPRIDDELASLIRQMSEENPRWGHMRVFGELRKLGFRASLQTVRRYRRSVPRDPSTSWRTFLRNHRPELWAADFFTVQTLTMRTLYVVFFIAHGRREVVHLNVTAHPTARWVWRQIIEATPWGRQPRYLLRDRDGAYGVTSSPVPGASASRSCSRRSRRPRRTRSRSGWWGRCDASASIT